jgi:hypothetical protein
MRGAETLQLRLILVYRTLIPYSMITQEHGQEYEVRDWNITTDVALCFLVRAVTPQGEVTDEYR